jgi:hypothetical protein
MLLILGALFALAIAIVVMVGRRVPWSVDPGQLGYVSERWLAEYRASHPSGR